jgi:hypothetical protein
MSHERPFRGPPLLFLLLLFALLQPVACRSPSAPSFPQLGITTAELPPATRGQPYAEGIHAEGGNRAYDWEVVTGSLPQGLALAVDDLAIDHALITGVPVELGTWAFAIRVRSGDGQAVTRQFSITVHPEPDPLAFSTVRMPPALLGGPYNVQLLAHGGDGAAYTWRLVAGTLPAGLSLSQRGLIQGTPTATQATTFTVEVASGGLAVQSTFTLRVVAPDAQRHRITTFEVVDVPAAVRPHLNAAIARAEAAITGNLPNIFIPTNFFTPSMCGGFGPQVNGTSVDDVLVIVNITDIDGPGRILGQAGPCGIRQGTSLPFVGILTLDIADVLPMVGTETLTDIITHEIAHVLGFGTLWAQLGLITGAGTAEPRFTGPRAVAEYNALGGTGDVPLETAGGAGTRDSHWSKTVFSIELMTGFVERVGIAQPVSRVTIAQWADMGYTVNMAAAEPFSLALGALHAEDADHRHGALGYDVVYDGPIVVLHRDGGSTVIRPGR